MKGLKGHIKELLLYGINGLIATAVHFSVLTINIQVLQFDSAGVANFVAAFFGIICSFLGSRYVVFPRTGEGIVSEFTKFGSLYGIIAVLHGLILFIWSDWFGLDYRLGFLVATCLQVFMSYIGNKFLVFRL